MLCGPGSVMESFYEDAPVKRGTCVFVDKDNLEPLKTAILNLPSAHVTYTEIGEPLLGTFLGRVMGMDSGTIIAQVTAERAKLEEVAEAVLEIRVGLLSISLVEPEALDKVRYDGKTGSSTGQDIKRLSGTKNAARLRCHEIACSIRFSG